MNRPEKLPSNTARQAAAAVVVGALLHLPDFLWDDQDVADCAHAAVDALEAAGWRPSPEPNEHERT